MSVSAYKIVAFINPPTPSHVEVASASAAAPTVHATSTPSALQEMLLLGQSDDTDLDATSTTDHLALIDPMVEAQIIGSYSALRQNGSYTKADLQQAGMRIAEYLKAAVAYDAFDASDFRTDSDDSVARVRQYRDQMVEIMKPFSDIKSAEYMIYGKYVETGDAQYLAELKSAAATYRSVADRGAAIVVPRDALLYHRDLLNSLRAFAAVLDGLSDHPDDAFASLALLRTYNEKEQGITESFTKMRSYFAQKSI